MAHSQDWEPVILRKHKGAGPAGPAKPKPKAAVEAKEEPLAHDRVNASISKRIVELRLARRWTQANLAQAINEQLATVRTYENGSAIPSPAVLAKLARALGVPTLRR